MDLATDSIGVIVKLLFLYVFTCVFLLWIASKVLP